MGRKAVLLVGSIRDGFQRMISKELSRRTKQENPSPVEKASSLGCVKTAGIMNYVSGRRKFLPLRCLSSPTESSVPEFKCYR